MCPRRSVRKINTDRPEMAPLKRWKLCQALIKSWLNWKKEKRKERKPGGTGIKRNVLVNSKQSSQFEN